jgi:hypothetical protein
MRGDAWFCSDQRPFVAVRNDEGQPVQLYDIVRRRIVTQSPAGNVRHTALINNGRYWVVDARPQLHVYDLTRQSWDTLPGLHNGLSSTNAYISVFSKEQERIKYILFPDAHRNTRNYLDTLYPPLTPAMRKKLGID